MMTQPGARVLIVDDDDGVRARLRSFLDLHGVAADGAADGESALRALREHRYDAVLLDVVMPGIDGLEVARRVRLDSDVPILMLTGRSAEADCVRGLELGADDYIAKPFRPRELLARVHAAIRRHRGASEPLASGGLEADVETRTARLFDVPLVLSGIEFDLLVALLRHRPLVLSREALLQRAGRNAATVTGRNVDVHISRLRKALGDDPRSPRWIKTVHGEGYVMLSHDVVPD